MRDWKAKVQLKDLIERYDEDEITLRTLATEVSGRVRGLEVSRLTSDEDEQDHLQGQLDDIADGFEWLSEDPTQDDFNHELDNLYDFGDVYGVWVETII